MVACAGLDAGQHETVLAVMMRSCLVERSTQARVLVRVLGGTDSYYSAVGADAALDHCAVKPKNVRDSEHWCAEHTLPAALAAAVAGAAAAQSMIRDASVSDERGSHRHTINRCVSVCVCV